MADAAEVTLLTVPPMPLATGGLLLSEDDGRTMRVSTVELVMTTEDGDQARMSLHERHGAWWPPTARQHIGV